MWVGVGVGGHVVDPTLAPMNCSTDSFASACDGEFAQGLAANRLGSHREIRLMRWVFLLVFLRMLTGESFACPRDAWVRLELPAESHLRLPSAKRFSDRPFRPATHTERG